MRANRHLALLWLVLCAGVTSCRGEEGPGSGHSNAVSRVPVDVPDESFGVLAVFMGCVPLSGAKLPSCPEGTRLSCRADTYWCHRPDDSRHGPSLQLSSSGTLLLEQQYRYGKRDGPWKQWDPDGHKIRDGQYVKGKKEGRWHGWHTNGRPHYLHEYSQGYRHGRWARWLPDGSMEAEGFYHFGNKVGRWRKRGADGGMTDRIFVDGVPLGSGSRSVE